MDHNAGDDRRHMAQATSRLGRFVGFFEKSPTYRLIGILIAVIGIPGAILSAWEPISTFLTRIERAQEEQQARIEQARGILLRQAAGNTGKGRALTTLYESGESLDGLDLSCAALGSTGVDGSCEARVIFDSVDLSLAKAGERQFPLSTCQTPS